MVLGSGYSWECHLLWLPGAPPCTYLHTLPKLCQPAHAGGSMGGRTLESGLGKGYVGRKQGGMVGGSVAVAWSEGLGPDSCITSEHAEAGPCLSQHLLATIVSRMTSGKFRSRVWKWSLAPATASQQGLFGRYLNVSLLSFTKIAGSCFLQHYPETTEDKTAFFIQPST